MKDWTPLKLLQPFIDFFYPPLCLSCKDRIAVQEEFLCPTCRARLVRVCETDHTMRVLAERFAQSGAVDGFAPLYYFEEHGVLQHVVHALKYGEMTSVGERFGEELGRMLSAKPGYEAIDLIIPVPLHLRKERERGYNQSDWICRGIARVLDAPVERRLVRRAKETRTQTKLSASERTENVCGAFTVEPGGALRLRKKTILLVDDVVTTGATIQSCAAELKRSGAARVLCASIGAAKLDAGDHDSPG